MGICQGHRRANAVTLAGITLTRISICGPGSGPMLRLRADFKLLFNLNLLTFPAVGRD